MEWRVGPHLIFHTYGRNWKRVMMLGMRMAIVYVEAMARVIWCRKKSSILKGRRRRYMNNWTVALSRSRGRSIVAEVESRSKNLKVRDFLYKDAGEGVVRTRQYPEGASQTQPDKGSEGEQKTSGDRSGIVKRREEVSVPASESKTASSL
jgi:hypothetical protein